MKITKKVDVEIEINNKEQCYCDENCKFFQNRDDYYFYCNFFFDKKKEPIELEKILHYVGLTDFFLRCPECIRLFGSGEKNEK